MGGLERGDHVDGDVDEAGEESAVEEERAAAPAIDEEAAGDTADEREDGVEGVEEELLVRAGDAGVFEHDWHEVAVFFVRSFGEIGRGDSRNDRAADELRENADQEE